MAGRSKKLCVAAYKMYSVQIVRTLMLKRNFVQRHHPGYGTLRERIPLSRKFGFEDQMETAGSKFSKERVQ
jgi:hypothetical protein